MLVVCACARVLAGACSMECRLTSSPLLVRSLAPVELGPTVSTQHSIGMAKQRTASPRTGVSIGVDGSPSPGMGAGSPAPGAKALHSSPAALRRLATRVLDFDHRASDVLHRCSLYPFDLAIAPFSLLCGIYSVPFLIPLIAFGESARLAALILTSVSVQTHTPTPADQTRERQPPEERRGIALAMRMGCSVLTRTAARPVLVLLAFFRSFSGSVC